MVTDCSNDLLPEFFAKMVDPLVWESESTDKIVNISMSISHTLSYLIHFHRN